MKGRTESSIQAGLNLGKNGPCINTIALALTGGQHGGEVIYATDRRSIPLGGKLGLEGQIALNPQPTADSRPVSSGTATFNYTLIWCSSENNRARELLTGAGYYWTRGGPTQPYADRYRHYLKVDAKNEEEACALSRYIITKGGGDATDLTIGRPDPDRVRLMAEAFDRAQANAEGSDGAA